MGIGVRVELSYTKDVQNNKNTNEIQKPLGKNCLVKLIMLGLMQ